MKIYHFEPPGALGLDRALFYYSFNCKSIILGLLAPLVWIGPFLNTFLIGNLSFWSSWQLLPVEIEDSSDVIHSASAMLAREHERARQNEGECVYDVSDVNTLVIVTRGGLLRRRLM